MRGADVHESESCPSVSAPTEHRDDDGGDDAAADVPTCVFACHWSECPDGRSELRWTEYPVVRISQHFVWIDDYGYGKRRRLPRADLELRGEVTVRIGRTLKRTFRSRKDDEAAPGVAAPGDRHDDAAADVVDWAEMSDPQEGT